MPKTSSVTNPQQQMTNMIFTQFHSIGRICRRGVGNGVDFIDVPTKEKEKLPVRMLGMKLGNYYQTTLCLEDEGRPANYWMNKGVPIYLLPR